MAVMTLQTPSAAATGASGWRSAAGRAVAPPATAPARRAAAATPGHAAAAPAHRSAAAPARRPAPPVRLTRRGRLVLLLVLVVVASVAFSLGRVSSHAGSDPPRAPRRSVVVRPGDSLWGIARAAAPHADPRETVIRIRELNHLGAAAVQPGQRLVLPD